MTYIVHNKALGNILVLGFDLLNNKALIHICENKYTPYVIVKGFNFKEGNWLYGTYYSNLSKAHKDFFTE